MVAILNQAVQLRLAYGISSANILRAVTAFRHSLNLFITIPFFSEISPFVYFWRLCHRLKITSRFGVETSAGSSLGRLLPNLFPSMQNKTK